jgi:VIT1/CCC1 family predicted Fe2+/Mn2+ transporter
MHESHDNHEPHKKGNKLSDVILGGQDGLVNVLGLLLGLAAATSSVRIILAGGLAATFAETLSMAAVAYTSKMADRDHYAAERAREVQEIKDVPEIETQEIRDIYIAKGFEGKLLEQIVTHITSDEDRWVDNMMRDELDLLPIDIHDIHVYSFTVGLSTLIGSILPLIPFFFLHVHPALVIALLISVVSLASVGIYKANTTLIKPTKSAIQMVVIGMGAAIAGYLIGLVFKH